MLLTRDTSADPSVIARSLFVRLAGRVEAAAQVRFLRALHLSPLADKAVVCGSAAIHGIFLHGRRTPTLDLVMPPLWAARFPTLMQAAGVAVSAGPVRNRYALPAGASSLPGLEVSVQVRPAQRMPENVERHTFSDSAGNKAAAATLPLVDLLADKLHVLAERHDVTDYLDAWLVLTRAPEAAAGVSAFDARRSLRYLEIVDDAQWQAVSRFVSPVPPLSQVADDLRGWWETSIDSRKYS